MRFVSPGHHRSTAEFREHLQRLDPAFDCVDAPSDASGPLGQSIDWGGSKPIGNRFTAHPMEGWDGTTDGQPTAHTLRRWRRFGRSGAKLIWGGEAFAVRADGRANPNQLYLNDDGDVAGALSSLLAELYAGHAEIDQEADDLVVGLQLTHSGRFSRPEGPPAPMTAQRHAILEAKYPWSKGVEPMTDGELEAIGERYVEAAKIAQKVGFDFVDVKCCHGYLLHEVLGAKTREGSYGGSFENRVKLFTRIVEGIRRECPGLGIGTRVSIVDIVPFEMDPDTRLGRPVDFAGDTPAKYGFGVSEDDPLQFDLDEPLRFLGHVRDLGIKLVNLTVGSPYYNPHIQRPAAYPPSDGYQPPDDPLGFVLRHLRTTRACKAAFPDLVLAGTGYTYLQEYLPHVAEYEVANGHVDTVGLGRMLLIYPELPHDVLAGRPLERKRLCRTFSDCTTAPRNGMISGCFPLDPYYKDMPEAAKVKALKKEILK